MNIYILIISFIFTVVFAALQIFKPSFFKKAIKQILWISVLTIFILSFVFSVLQYRAWRENDLMKFVFESQEGIFGFIHNAFFNHFASHTLSAFLSLILILLMFLINKKYQERFFEKEELFLAFIGGFLSGFPGFLFFLLAIIVIYLLVHFINAITKKTISAGVIPLYYFWIPVSSFVIILSAVIFYRLDLWRLLSV